MNEVNNEQQIELREKTEIHLFCGAAFLTV